VYRERLLQNKREHDEFISILQREGVRSYLEIGSMYGGSLWRVAHALPPGSRIVAVDYMCDAPAAQPSLEACVKALADEYDAHLILGDSGAPDTIAKVGALGPFDCVFIDGDHLLDAVMSDWHNYGPMGRIVALHDISWNETWRSSAGKPPKPMGVPKLWDELKQKYRHKELRYQVPRNYYGIGVLWTV
jgi:predicted O-methyltransferase YrrM